MRIAVIVRYFPRVSQTFVLNQITGLLKRGHQVDIYALDNYFADNPDVHPDIEKYRVMERVHVIPKRRSVAYVWHTFKSLINLMGVGPQGWRLLKHSLNFRKYGSIVKSFRLMNLAALFYDQGPYDVVHCQFGVMGRWIEKVRDLGLLSGKFIVAFRGHDISQYLRTEGEHVYDSLFTKIDLALPNCEHFKRRLMLLGCEEKKIKVQYSGIDLSQFIRTVRYQPTNGPIRLLSVARLVEKKGIEYCIEAVSMLKRSYPQLEYSIIGDGKLKNHFRKIIQDLEADSYIHLLGAMKQQEIYKLINRYHIFLAPSVTSDAGDEDAPINTLKEAMAVGMPVITTNHGGIPELVEDGVSGFLVPEKSVSSLIEKIDYLIKHPEEWAQMGIEGRKKVESKFDSERLNDRLITLYRAEAVKVKECVTR